MKIWNVFGNRYSGTIGDNLTASRWKGIEYVREWFRSRNPRTELQVEQRELFADAVEGWQSLTPVQQKAYDMLASGKHMSGFNLYVREYILAGRSGQSVKPPVELNISVVDKNGKALSGAVVKIVKKNKLVYEAKTAKDGKCRIALLEQQEPYDVVVQHGSKVLRKTGLRVKEIKKTTFQLVPREEVREQ